MRFVSCNRNKRGETKINLARDRNLRTAREHRKCRVNGGRKRKTEERRGEERGI